MKYLLRAFFNCVTLDCAIKNDLIAAACFISDYGSYYIELTTGGRPDIIQPYQLQNLGVETSEGLKFPLSEKFSFRTVNVGHHLTLRLRIEDSNANNVLNSL